MPKQWPSVNEDTFSVLAEKDFVFRPTATWAEMTAPGPFLVGRKLAPAVLARLGWDAMSPLEVNELIAQAALWKSITPIRRGSGKPGLRSSSLPAGGNELKLRHRVVDHLAANQDFEVWEGLGALQ